MQTVKNYSGRAKDYFFYFLKTRFKFNIHSPFVYNFVDQVLDDANRYAEYALIESFYNKYRKSQEKLTIREHFPLRKGKQPKNKQVTLGKLVRNSSVESREGRLLFRMVRYYKPEYLLEMGTSLGFSTMYQALGTKEYPVKAFCSMEGCNTRLSYAEKFRDQIAVQEAAVNKIRFVPGLFDSTLPGVLDSMPRVDFVFFDGNHHKDALMRYFYACLDKAHENSIFVFDDIYHSRSMKKAWETIKINPRVRTTVDLFSLGIVFFNNPYAKQNFTVRF